MVELIREENGASVTKFILAVLFMIFLGIAALALIQSGDLAVERVAESKNSQAGARIAASYINARLRMNDAIGRVEVARIDRTGGSGILIRHRTAAADFDRWIFFENGRLLEALTDPGAQPQLMNAAVIAELYDFEITYDKRRGAVSLRIDYEHESQIQTIVTIIGFRSDRAEGIIIL